MFRYDCPLRWGDMDAQGHVNNGAFLDYLQEARVHYLLLGPPVLQQLLTTGVLVVAHQVEYLRPLTFGDALTVELWVSAVGGSRFEIGYDLTIDGAEPGDSVVRARTAAVPYDLAAGRLRRLTPEERTALSRDLQPAESLRAVPTLRWPVGTEHRHPVAVRWSDLDSYGHVNNVRFFDYVQEARLALMAEVFGWPVGEAEQSSAGLWLVVRQDVEYARPLDFRLQPYEVGTAVAHVGSRSFTLAVQIRDPAAGTPYATGCTVVVAPEPLTARQRERLARWQV